MTDDDLWNLILGNNANGPSVTPFANNLGQEGAGVGSPPSNGGSILDKWKSTGLGGDTLAMLLPQRDDTSAASLSPSALQLSVPLQSPNPPPISVEQLAMMYGMSPQQIAAIGTQAKIDAWALVGLKNLLGPVAEALFPEPSVASYIATRVIDTSNHISEPSDEQYIQDAPDKAVYQHLNDSLAQPYESPTLPGLRSRFPFP